MLLPVKVEPLIRKTSPLSIAPPPFAAVLFKNVAFVMSIVPNRFRIAPPLGPTPVVCTEFPVNVELEMVIVPLPTLIIAPPPLPVAPPPLEVLFVKAHPLIITVPFAP